MTRKTVVPAFVGILIMVALLGWLRYQSSHHKIEVAEVMQDLEMTTLRTKNPGCKVTGPDGSPIPLSEGKVFIPKGAFITPECFAIQAVK